MTRASTETGTEKDAYLKRIAEASDRAAVAAEVRSALADPGIHHRDFHALHAAARARIAEFFNATIASAGQEAEPASGRKGKK
jgi:hypothetical protein